MFTEPMHGPIAAAIFWIWLGFVAVAVLGYWLLRPWLNRRKKPPPTMKYAQQLRQRMRKTPSSPEAAPPGGADISRKPPSTRR